MPGRGVTRSASASSRKAGAAPLSGSKRSRPSSNPRSASRGRSSTKIGASSAAKRRRMRSEESEASSSEEEDEEDEDSEDESLIIAIDSDDEAFDSGASPRRGRASVATKSQKKGRARPQAKHGESSKGRSATAKRQRPARNSSSSAAAAPSSSFPARLFSSSASSSAPSTPSRPSAPPAVGGSASRTTSTTTLSSFSSPSLSSAARRAEKPTDNNDLLFKAFLDQLNSGKRRALEFRDNRERSRAVYQKLISDILLAALSDRKNMDEGYAGQYRLQALYDMFTLMYEKCGASCDESVLLDIGHGNGSPVMQAALSGFFKRAVGVEINDTIYGPAYIAALHGIENVSFHKGDAGEPGVLEKFAGDASHIYSFNRTFPDAEMHRIGKALAKMKKWRFIISSLSADEWAFFGLDEVEDVETVTGLAMSGSGSQHAMFLVRRIEGEELKAKRAQRKLEEEKEAEEERKKGAAAKKGSSSSSSAPSTPSRMTQAARKAAAAAAAAQLAEAAKAAKQATKKGGRKQEADDEDEDEDKEGLPKWVGTKGKRDPKGWAALLEAERRAGGGAESEEEEEVEPGKSKKTSASAAAASSSSSGLRSPPRKSRSASGKGTS